MEKPGNFSDLSQLSVALGPLLALVAVGRARQRILWNDPGLLDAVATEVGATSDGDGVAWVILTKLLASVWSPTRVAVANAGTEMGFLQEGLCRSSLVRSGYAPRSQVLGAKDLIIRNSKPQCIRTLCIRPYIDAVLTILNFLSGNILKFT